MPQILMVKDAETGAIHKLDFSQNTVTLPDKNGRLVTMDLGTSDVHIDTPLANYAVGYMQDPAEYVADQVSPVVLVDKPTDKYYVWDKDDAFQEANSMVTTPGGDVGEVAPRQSNTNYVTVQYGLKTFLPTEVEAAADDGLRIAMRYMQRPIEALRLGRERRVALSCLSATNFSSSSFKVTLGATEKWNGGTASDPIKNIHERMEASLKPITHMVMSEQTWHAFQRNAQVQKYIASKTNVRPLASKTDPNEFAAILELPQIIVGRAKYKSSASAYSYIWGTAVGLFTLPKTVPPMGQAISWNTFRWKGGNEAGVTQEGGMAVRSYFNPFRGAQGGREIVVYHQDAEQFVDQSVSGLIIDAYQ